MKKIYLGASFFFFLIALIIALQNVANESYYQIFFDDATGSLFGPAMTLFGIGFLSGVFFTLAMKVKKKKIGDYDSDLSF